MAALDLDQGLEVDLTPEKQQTGTELDVTNVGRMTVLQINVQIPSHVILMVMSQTMQPCKLCQQIQSHVVLRILIAIWKIQSI